MKNRKSKEFVHSHVRNNAMEYLQKRTIKCSRYYLKDSIIYIKMDSACGKSEQEILVVWRLGTYKRTPGSIPIYLTDDDDDNYSITIEKDAEKLKT